MRKIFFLSLFILILFFLFLPRDFSLAAAECTKNEDCLGRGEHYVCQRGKCVESRGLEIEYPKIPGVLTPKVVAAGLPEYVNYIFRLSIIIIGFIIFGVLVYSGIRYLTSAGDPAKLGDAREGILAAFLGAVILLSAYLIFNTINPQLTILELPPVELLAAVVTPGVYICNYTASDIGTVLEYYIQKGPKQNFDAEKQKEAAKKLREIMVNPTDTNKRCPMARVLENFEKPIKDNNTMFIIPTIQIINDERIPFYEYGIVLHEKDDQRGKCMYYPYAPSGGSIYAPTTGAPCQIHGCKPTGLGFEANSATVFQKSKKEPAADAKAIILYTCQDRNRISCPVLVNANGDGQAFPNYGADIKIYTDLGQLTDNIRSIDIKPENSFFALFFDNTNTNEGNCAVVKNFKANTSRLGSLDTVGCPKLWQLFISPFWYLLSGHDCRAAIKSMIVIKGL